MRAVYSSILLVGILLHGHFGLAVVHAASSSTATIGRTRLRRETRAAAGSELPRYSPAHAVLQQLPQNVLDGVLDFAGPEQSARFAKVSTGSREAVQERRGIFQRRAERQLDTIWQAYKGLAARPLANYQRALDEGRGLDRSVRSIRMRDTPRELRKHIPPSGGYYPEFVEEFSTNQARAFLLHGAKEGSARARGTGGAGRRLELGGFFFDTDLLLQMGELGFFFDHDMLLQMGAKTIIAHAHTGVIRLRKGATVRILGDWIPKDPHFRDRRWGDASDVNPVAQALISGSFANKPDRVGVSETRMIETNDQTGDEGIGKVVCMFRRCMSRDGVCEQSYVVDVPYRSRRASRRRGGALPAERFLIEVPAQFLRFLAPVAVDRSAGVQLGFNGGDRPGPGRGRGPRQGGSVSWDDTRLPFEVAGGGWPAEADAEERRCRAEYEAYNNNLPFPNMRSVLD